MRSWWLALPPLLLALLLLLLLGLREDPAEIPSPLVGKPFPLLAGETLEGGQASLGGAWPRPTLVNVWASWCVACRQEHPVMVEAALTYAGRIDFIGLNYKDSKEDGKQWLERFGDPYQWSLFDAEGRAGLELGVYGVPETFFVSPAGLIVHKQVGPLDARTLAENLSRYFPES